VWKKGLVSQLKFTSGFAFFDLESGLLVFAKVLRKALFLFLIIVLVLLDIVHIAGAGILLSTGDKKDKHESQAGAYDMLLFHP